MAMMLWDHVIYLSSHLFNNLSHWLFELFLILYHLIIASCDVMWSWDNKLPLSVHQDYQHLIIHHCESSCVVHTLYHNITYSALHSILCIPCYIQYYIIIYSILIMYYNTWSLHAKWHIWTHTHTDAHMHAHTYHILNIDTQRQADIPLMHLFCISSSWLCSTLEERKLCLRWLRSVPIECFSLLLSLRLLNANISWDEWYIIVV